ncbi:fluoride efflux transporter CrcB [Streptomyces aurantiogriseus]|uniref:Fluoride-specific ion channel FluC n=1 Tax=Streptomyces aurantiogriseus TaxID=66870 RepID=A0A918KZJ8_9ACTN|nr:fluoride efflux transporter CrcB [Streptomyces aurantiogriseus]GGR55739.1 putative fluoride ion transporter CrcB 1 [Streptomyces aurantiogriseus]
MTFPEPGRRPGGVGQFPVVAVVALGGGLGATARYAASLWWSAQPGGFPWTTFWVNVVGCAVIGLFLVLITETLTPHRLVRPFFGTGVLGGFTTFSTYAVDLQQLFDTGHPRTALAYLAATPLAALTAVWLAATATRQVVAGVRLTGRYGTLEADNPGVPDMEGKKSS